MSYILDALKKAEADRQLGSVPNIHLQPAAPLPSRGAPASGKIWLIAAVCAGLGASAFFAWQQSGRSPVGETPPAPLAVQAPVQAAAVPAENPQPAQTQAAPPAPAMQAPAETKPQTPAPAAKRETPESTRKRHAVRSDAAPKQNPAPATQVAQANPNAQEQLPPSARELPENVQRELPPLAIGGYIYSDNPRERQLLADKRLLREGEEAAPGLVLEKMLPKTAVFNYKGQRFQVAY